MSVTRSVGLDLVEAPSASRRPPATSGKAPAEKVAGGDGDLLGQLEKIGLCRHRVPALPMPQRRPAPRVRRAGCGPAGPDGHQHLDHELVGPVHHPAKVEVGIGDQANRPGHTPGADLAGLIEHLAGGKGDMPSSAAAALGSVTPAPSRRNIAP